MKKKTPASFQKSCMIKREESDLKWLILDAKGKTLGRFAAEVAKILRGKHKVYFTPHVDCGDGVLVINADQIKISGDKEAQKIYREYTGYIGGLKEIPYRDMMQKKPTKIIEHAVAGMMPKTRLGKKQLTRLRITVGEEHKLQAQKPVAVAV